MPVAITTDIEQTRSCFPRQHPLPSRHSHDAAFGGRPGPKALHETGKCYTVKRMGGSFGQWKAVGVGHQGAKPRHGLSKTQKPGMAEAGIQNAFPLGSQAAAGL